MGTLWSTIRFEWWSDDQCVSKKAGHFFVTSADFDPGLSLYTAIFLGSMKMSHDEIKALIMRCDQERLDESAIESLLKYLPSAEQVRLSGEREGGGGGGGEWAGAPPHLLLSRKLQSSFRIRRTSLPILVFDEYNMNHASITRVQSQSKFSALDPSSGNGDNSNFPIVRRYAPCLSNIVWGRGGGG